MNARENYLRTVRFEKPDYIPVFFHINDACWQNYPQEFLFDLMEKHRNLFPEFVCPKEKYVPRFSLVARKDESFKDDWGCLWTTSEDGITGSVTKHPLEQWDNFDNYKAPDPEYVMGIGTVDWKKEKARILEEKVKGKISIGGLRHGHTFLQLCDIRGYQNALFDMIDEEPKFDILLKMITDFNIEIIKKYIAIGADVITIPEDLGMQNGPMLSPECFKKYIKPAYQKYIQPVREEGIVCHMHSDGDIRLLASDIIDGGVNVLNLQDLVNGIDWIRENLKGKVCIDLDIDRQSVTRFGTPKEIDTLILEEVKKLGAKYGGLMMVYGLYPEVPLENIEALCNALEKYMFYYS